MTDFYHYTTVTGYRGIPQSGYILESTKLDDGDDARFGQGVYLTTVPPSAGKKAIIETCWGPNQVSTFTRNGQIDYVIRIRIPPHRVKQAAKNRAVFLHRGVLYLKEYSWDASLVSNRN